MNENLKILLLEDSEEDADLIEHKLKQGGIKFTSLIVDTRADYINAIRDFKPDVILSDHSLPQFNSAEALKIYKEHQKKQNIYAPFILITGAVSEEFAVQCIKDGADDYILKDRLQRLPIAIKNTLEKCRIENENQKATAEKLLLLERYEYITNATSQAIWDWDIENDSIYCGKGFEKIFGHCPGGITQLGNLHTNWISADDIERVLSGIETAIATTAENNWQDEYKYLMANGEYAFVSDCAVIIRNEEGKAIRMIGAMKDITTKKKEDLRLKLLESAIINTTDGIIIVKIDSTEPGASCIEYVNEAFTKIKGYTREEVMGKAINILCSERTDKEVSKRLLDAFEKNEPYQAEMSSRKKNGVEFWIHFAMAPIADDKGRSTHWVLILRDITQQRKHVKAIEDQNLQLKDIAWMQSHIIRAPLARMMGFINLINASKETQNEKTDLLPYVLSSALELDVIIRGIVEKSEKINDEK